MKSFARILAPLAVAAFLAPVLSLFAQSKPATSNEIDTPKVEIFLGYSRFGTFSNNVVDGNRFVGVNGGSGSVAFNFNRWIGLVADVSGYDDSQLVLTGTGANQPVTPQQVQAGVGNQAISNIAAKLGVSPDVASGVVAQLLPHVVDHMTPGGQVPAAGGGDMLSMGESILKGLLNK